MCSNVLIDEEGRACLADLALAKVLASCPARTAAGATYTYAGELARGVRSAGRSSRRQFRRLAATSVEAHAPCRCALPLLLLLLLLLLPLLLHDNPASPQPAAAAPEQLMGQRCTLAADMFSLGAWLPALAGSGCRVRVGWPRSSRPRCMAMG